MTFVGDDNVGRPAPWQHAYLVEWRVADSGNNWDSREQNSITAPMVSAPCPTTTACSNLAASTH